MSERKRPDAVALTDAFLQNLTRMKDPAKGKVRRDIYDALMRGLILRATPGGSLSWYASYAVKGTGKVVMERLGSYPAISLAEARGLATQSRDQARNGDDPRALKAEKQAAEKAARAEIASDGDRNRFGTVQTAYIEAKRRNRSIFETKRMLETFFSDWADRDIRTIKRSEIETRLKAVGARKMKGQNGKPVGGPIRREGALRQLRAMMNWHEIAEADLSGWRAPIFRGLVETSITDCERDHYLSDEEIAALWTATEDWDQLSEHSIFSSIVRLLVLSAQRRSEICNLQRSEIDEHGVWRLPRERNKVRDQHALPLTETMRTIIDKQPRFMIRKGNRWVESDFVFTGTGTTGFTAFSKSKQALDAAMLAAMQKRASERGEDPDTVELRPWRLHDLRRTTRTLGERVGVVDTVMERVLGHRQQGVMAVYAKFQYLPQKEDALRRIEAEIMRIVGNKPPAKVVLLSEAKHGRGKDVTRGGN